MKISCGSNPIFQFVWSDPSANFAYGYTAVCYDTFSQTVKMSSSNLNCDEINTSRIGPLDDMGTTTETKAQNQSTHKLYTYFMECAVSAILIFHRINLISVTRLTAGKQFSQYNGTKDFHWMALHNNALTGRWHYETKWNIKTEILFLRDVRLSIFACVFIGI